MRILISDNKISLNKNKGANKCISLTFLVYSKLTFSKHAQQHLKLIENGRQNDSEAMVLYAHHTPIAYHENMHTVDIPAFYC